MELIDNLKNERDLLLRRIEAIDLLLESYIPSDGIIGRTKFKDNDYPTDGSYFEQIAYIIKKANRFLNNNEIREEIKKHSNRKKDQDDAFLKRRVSSVLSDAKNEEGSNLINIRVGNSLKNTFWGSKDWLNENGEPLPDHMYNKELVIAKKNKGINI